MNWYRVVKTIKGRRYVYEQRTWREGKRVRTESRYIGPAGAGDAGPAGQPAGPPHTAEERPPQPAFDPALIEQAFELLQQLALVPHESPWSTRRQEQDHVEKNEAIERCIEVLGVHMTHDKWGGAYYNPAEDIINIPKTVYFMNFKEENATQTYYATILHELIHWTGAKSRLARPQDKYESDIYAREELIAEAGAVALALYFGVASKDMSRHADYFVSWMSRFLYGDHPEEELEEARLRVEEAVRYIIERGVNTTGQGERGVA